MKNEHTYIIAGGGCSGLSLVKKLCAVLKQDESILVLDQDCHKEHKKTLAFWSNNYNDNLEQYYQWNNIKIQDAQQTLLKPSNYKYFMTEGNTYVNQLRKNLSANPAVRMIDCRIQRLLSGDNFGVVITDSGSFKGKYIFNSCTPSLKNLINPDKPILYQQFCGYYIETEQAVFKRDEATLMDFNTDQSKGVTFGYILPLSETKALVELVIFTEQMYPPTDVKEDLNKYINTRLQNTSYNILSKECSWLPMQSGFEAPDYGERIINIGLLGGNLKASTGYCFYNILKQSDRIVERLKRGKTPKTKNTLLRKRFQLYDDTFIRVLMKREALGSTILMDLFTNNSLNATLKFLNNESSILEELRLFLKVNVKIFTSAILSSLVHTLGIKKNRSFKRAAPEYA